MQRNNIVIETEPPKWFYALGAGMFLALILMAAFVG